MAPRLFRIVIEGEIGASVAGAFEGMDLTYVDGTSVLTGTVRDQAELLGIVTRVASLGLTLVSAAAVGADGAPDSA